MACVSLTTATTARTLPPGKLEGGVSVEYQSVEAVREAADDHQQNWQLLPSVFLRKGLATGVELGVRGTVSPAYPLAVGAFAQSDIKLSIVSGRVGAVAVAPTLALGVWESDFAFYGEDRLWLIDTTGHLPILALVGSDGIAAVMSLGPSATRVSRHREQSGWTDEPWLVAVRATGGCLLRLSGTVAVLPEAVVGLPINDDSYWRFMGGGVALVFRERSRSQPGSR